MAQMGMEQALTLTGFLALVAVILGLAVALQVIWRMGAAHAEEEAGRLEVVLARPISRTRWLGGHVLLTALGGVFLLAALAVAIWGGAELAGSTQMTLWDTTRAMANTVPVVALCGGLAVLMYGLAPRLTVALPVAVVIVSYVVSLLGPALKWPQAAMNLSMFSHLAMVPASPWAPTSGLVMTGLGVAAAGAGILAFRRRDIASG
jgi:ABC-2 type transport system permease protein